MARTKGYVNFAVNFEPTGQSPLDARLVVEKIADLTAAETYASKNYYPGMTVTVLENQCIYILKDPNNITNPASWVKVGSEQEIYHLPQVTVSDSDTPLEIAGQVGNLSDFLSAIQSKKILLATVTDESVTNPFNVVCSYESNSGNTEITLEFIYNSTIFKATLTNNSAAWTNMSFTKTALATPDNVVNSVTATADKGIEVAGTTTNPTIGLKIDSTGNVSLTTSENGLKADIGATPEAITSLLAEDDKVLDAARLASGRYGISSTLGLTYDNGTKKINLTGKENAVIATIDATDFIKDGMVQSVELQGNNLVITFNTDAGAEPISVDLSKFLDVYTAGNGISISGKSIAAKVDPDTEQFLTVGANGLKISGIHAEITEAVSQALTWTEVGE